MSDAENDLDIRRSSRRRESNKVQSRNSALEAMKEARRSGRMHRANVDDLVKDVYEEVDEEEYNKIVRRRQAEDFVVDDDGGGYVDHGADIFDDDEDDEQSTEKRTKKKKNKEKKETKKSGLDSYFAATTSTSSTLRSKVKDESQVNLDNDDMLKNMLADLDDANLELDAEPAAPSVMTPRGSSNPFARGTGTKRVAQDDVITPRPVTKKIALTSKTTQRQPKIALKSRSPAFPVKTADVKIEDNYEDDFGGGGVDDFDDVDMVLPPTTPADVKIDEQSHKLNMADVEDAKSVPAVVKEEDSAKTTIKMLAEANWENVQADDEPVVEVVAGKEEFYAQENGQTMVRMYWMDAYEDPVKHNGTVYLFGRVMVDQSRSASCCVVVKNVQRQVYFLPRQTRVVRGESTEKPVATVEVFEEIKSVLMREAGVASFKCKPVLKKFMNDGTLEEGEHEKDMEVIEVRYDSTSTRLPLDLTGETFSAVFNTTTTPMERLLVEREMMGPGWIDISNYVEVSAKQSFCDYEFSVDMERMTNVTYNSTEKKFAPFARLLAINVVTTLNGKDNEICMISVLFNPKACLTNPSTDPKFLQRMCLVTKPHGGALPFDLRDYLTVRRLNQMVQSTANEKALLTLFLAKLQKWEPDVYVGHDLAATMDLLKTRMQKLSVANWSRTSRLKRSAALSTVRGNKAGQWELTAGRMLVDSRLAAMELVRSRSFDLTELSSQLLNCTRENIYANEVAAKFTSSAQLLNLIQWSWMDPLLSLRVVAHLNALPLFMQITNIVGGVASRTLMGGRAERNEFLLLHAFNKGNIIAPNKHQPTFAKKGAGPKKLEAGGESAANEEGADNENDATAGSKNKAQYAGGLVLEPKKGLYDTLILLLDFNSLYPSIIQEYNICFTTVKHSKDGSDLPDIPSGGLSEGVLPREIRGLVERRRQVKSLMKAKEQTEAQRKKLDIRQMALKLTANSMYGCLGFQQSRFYAKPLAALVTSKGREILMHTKDLVEKSGYSVVYGDTDSIMINTNSTDLQQAKKLGNEIKKQVNQCHRLLELDMDGVFKRMLLLKKKKYAALTVNPDNELDVKKELKGLDIVRRDWSQIAKEAGNAVVNLILDPALSREELVAAIDDSLTALRKRLDDGSIQMNLFQISKQLTRNPREYHDLKAQPHAAVAARLNDSGKFSLKQGDIVEYVICEDGTTNSATQRAYHCTEMEDNKDLKIDLQYYLAQQIHPVVSRLCAPIEETDAVRIAQSLGMDSSSYRRAVAALSSEGGGAEDELAWQTVLSFDHCDGLAVPCPKNCGQTIRIRNAVEVEDGVARLGLEACDKCSCQLAGHGPFIMNQLEDQLTEYVAKQLTSYFKCDDTVCEYRVQAHPLKWSREGLECPKCSGGVLRKEYTAKDLFDQQSFLRQILDLPTAMAALTTEQKRSLESRANFPACQSLSLELLSVVDRFLSQNAYNRVDLAFLFAPMLKI